MRSHISNEFKYHKLNVSRSEKRLKISLHTKKYAFNFFRHPARFHLNVKVYEAPDSNLL